MSDPNDPKRSSSHLGEATPEDLDANADALLDSLLFDDSLASAPPPPIALPSNVIRLHQPTSREYSEDDVTVIGRTDDLFPGAAMDDGTTGLEDLAGSDIDHLLSSLPASPMTGGNDAEGRDRRSDDAPPRLPEIPAAPRLPAVPRPEPRMASAAPRPETTARPPAINPAGPPSRQPFPPAMSPRAPVAATSEAPARLTSAPFERPLLEPALIETIPPSEPPASLNEPDEEEELTRVYIAHSSISVPPPSRPPQDPHANEAQLLPDAFLSTHELSGRHEPLGRMQTPRTAPPSRTPTLPVVDLGNPLHMPPIPGPQVLPAGSVRDSEFELFPETPAGFSAADLEQLDDPAEPHEADARSRERPSLSPSIWPDERPARDHLSGQGEAFAARAQWFEREAHAASDPQAKVRALIVASELWALLGDVPRAREVATEASAIPRAHGMAARQSRALAAAEGDFKAVAPALEMEIRSAATVDARVHAAYLSAEVYRLTLSDDVTAKKKLDLAVRAQQEDPRAHVAKLSELLGKSSAPARVRLPDSEQLSELARASEELLRLRGAPWPAGSTPAQGPRAAFEEARRALSAGEREKTADALDKLASVSGLAPACAWLAACLLGADPKTRGRAIVGLSALAAQSGSRLARRALVTRALEDGDAAAVRNAVVGPQGEQTFSAADRLALAALTGLPATHLETTVWEVAGDAELRPLASAFVAATGGGSLDVRSGGETSRTEQRLGQALVTPPAFATDLSYLQSDAQAFEAMHPGSPLSRLLGLELARVARDKSQVALALSDWRHSDDPHEARDRQLAAALVHELAGAQGAATASYLRALDLDPTSEAAVRALSSAAPEETAELLLALSERLEPSARAALTVLEAALRQGSGQPDLYDALLDRARLADPELPLSYRLAEVAARRRADGEALLTALRARREAADDPSERALDLVREALLVADTDLPLAERLLDEALKARPADLGLRELAERMVPMADGERAAWREALAEVSEAPLRGRLLAEAALERARASELEAAARNAYLAVENGAGALTHVAAERFAALGPAAARLSESLLERARRAELPDEQRPLYERLSHIDRARGDGSSALLWQTAILEQSPHYLPALRRLEDAYISGDRLDELEPIAASLARTLDAQESNAHARLAARLSVRRGAWLEAREMAEVALAHAPNELWALRTLSAHARATEDSELGLQSNERLFELAERPLDKATLALRAAQAAAHLERPQDTKRLLSAALEQVPDHFVALTTLAAVLEANGEYQAAALALERVARASHLPAHQLSAWHQAAVLWLDMVGDGERGRSALECAVRLDVSHEDAVARLQTLYVAANDRQKLADLLQRRLERTSDPEERIAIEVTRGRALFEVGERDAAKAALSSALDANPDHAEALEAFASLCLDEGDWTSGEQALIRLARRASDPAHQAQIYRRLGELYDTALPNPERAELAYKEVLKRDPNDAETVGRLVHVYGRLGDKSNALSLQTDLLTRAKTPEEKRARTLALALVEEQTVGDRKRAEATFDKARKEWPYDSAVLRAVAEFQQRGGETRATQVLLDRAATDARRALATGRFEQGFFEVLATVAELKNAGDAALIARSTLAALHGEEVPVPAAGPIAGDPRLDDLLAPDLVNPPLRALLKKTGNLLDAAYPVDLRALRAAPLPVSSAAFTSYVQQVAAAFGLRALEVLASPTLGPICMPVSSDPPQIVFGQALLDSDDDAARYFLLIRSLKILQGNAATLSRTAPVDLWPVLSGFLSVFAQDWIAQGVDAKKLLEAQQRVSNVLRTNLDDDVPVLALEVIGAIGNRASLLGTALHQWGNRTALLSAGSLVASLRGVSLASSQPGGPPPDGGERVKWIVRNPEARDLATFGVSEQYAEARSRLGLAR